MNLEHQKACKFLVDKYRTTRDSSSRQRIRNELFCTILPYMQKWVKTSLGRRKIFLEKNKLLSVCWEAFCFCMDAYKNLEVPFPSHFSRNVEYFIIKCLTKKHKLKKKEIYLDELQDGDFLEKDFYPIDISGMKIISSVSFLKMFRSSLSNEYKDIFDEALTGKKEKNKDKIGVKKGYLPNYRYQEAKKVFKMVIEFSLIKCDETEEKNNVC